MPTLIITDYRYLNGEENQVITYTSGATAYD
jgi:hypothetical protein